MSSNEIRLSNLQSEDSLERYAAAVGQLLPKLGVIASNMLLTGEHLFRAAKALRSMPAARLKP